MPGGIYAALSGMQVRMQDLDRVASDLANVGTSGYKAERFATNAAERAQFARELDSAIDVVEGERKLDSAAWAHGHDRPGPRCRARGRRILRRQDPGGRRYTRDGAFIRRGDGVLTTRDGNPVVGEDGDDPPRQGTANIAEDGTIRDRRDGGRAFEGRHLRGRRDRTRVGRALPGRRRRHPPGLDGQGRGGSLEAANVTVVDRMAALTEISRAFEGLQRGISVLANDIDGRAITELGRR